MIDCKMALTNLYEYLDKHLDDCNCEELEKHLELCRECYDRTEFEKALRSRIKDKCGKIAPSDECVKKIRGILDKFCK